MLNLDKQPGGELGPIKSGPLKFATPSPKVLGWMLVFVGKLGEDLSVGEDAKEWNHCIKLEGAALISADNGWIKFRMASGSIRMYQTANILMAEAIIDTSESPSTESSPDSSVPSGSMGGPAISLNPEPEQTREGQASALNEHLSSNWTTGNTIPGSSSSTPTVQETAAQMQSLLSVTP